MENNILGCFENMLAELGQSNLASHKKEVLNKYLNSDNKDMANGIKKLLGYIFDYDKNFYITSKVLTKGYVPNPFNFVIGDIFTLLESLQNRIYTGHAACDAVLDFIKTHGYEDLIYKILDKDLGAQISTKTINAVAPGTIREFNVALADRLDDKTDLSKDDWYISIKFDGVRCICFYNNSEDIKFYSRVGNELTTLDALKDSIKRLNLPDNSVLDGEVGTREHDNIIDFKKIMKEIKRKDYTIPNPKYLVFDILTKEEFLSGTSTRTLKERWDSCPIGNLGDVWGVEQVKYTPESFEAMKTKAIRKGWEGLMLRKDTSYKGKRSKDLLKYKAFFDAEYLVHGVGFTTKGMLQPDGTKKDVQCVGELVIVHKGVSVGVGSGLSDEERLAWYENPKLIEGKTITVQYFEETLNDKGEVSLRFPTLKAVHGEKRDL